MEAHRVVRRLRVPQYLDNRLTDGGKVVSLRRRQPFIPQEGSWYSFLLEAESPQGHSAAGRMKNSTSLGLEPATFRLVA
jgi:hypothetical protein